MKKAYQIDERKAINRFRSYFNTNPGNIQMVLPLADLAQRLRQGVSQMLFDTERDLLTMIMSEEIKWLSQEHGMERWGTAPGSVTIHGQKCRFNGHGFATTPKKPSWAATSCSA